MIIYDNTGKKILDITVDDNSYRHRVIMGDHNITLHYSLAEHVEIPVGAYCEFQGERYTLMRPESLKMKHSRNFEYTVVLEAGEAKARIWKFRNPVDGRLKFPLTAKPKEHLQMFVDNMNRRDTGWKIGECVDGTETLISYNHVFCLDALAQMASEFNTEYEITGKTVSLRKVEYNKNNPLALSYGRGNGFKPGVGRSNYGDTPPIEILYVQGGTDNIDASKYGSTELLLPKNQSIRYDGVYFEDEDGFNPDNARMYITDDLGYSIRRGDKELTSLAEDSLDCSDIYPKRVGTVSGVVVVDAANNFYDIVDNTIPTSLNYEDYLIEGETMTIIFQSGMLAGREFEVKYYHEAVKEKSARRFEIIPTEMDGQTMPNNTFAPKAGDTYAVFKCMLPDAYICDNVSKSGASWDMFRTGVKYLFDNEEQKFTFSGELDGIWSKKDWINIGGRIVLGGYIRFTDERFQKDGVLVRITGIKDYINNPYSPEIELSNSTVSGNLATTLQQIESEEVLVEKYHRDALQFTKRRFRDAKETMSMLEDALLENFTNSITPITVQTMSMLVGDESLQFRFVNSKTNPVAVAHNITYDGTAKQLKAPAGIIQHMTLGIDTISSTHKASEYKYWDMPEYTSARLEDGTKKYYLYAKVSKTAQTGVFLLSETAIKLEGVTGYYHLLVGVLNSEYDGERSFVTLYGFSEILPGRVTTDRIVSPDGTTYFDLVKGEIGGNIQIKTGSSGLHNFNEWEELNGQIAAIEQSIDAVDESVDDLGEYVDGAFADGIITEAEAKAIEKYINTVNNTKAAVEATYNKLYANNYLTGTAKTNLLNAKITLFGAIDNLLSAINTAIADGKTTVTEKNNVDSKFNAFNTALASFNTAVEAANKAIQDALKSYSDECFAELEVLNGQIAAQVTRIDGLTNRIDTAGWITTADGNELWASKTLENGSTIISKINQTATSVKIQASHIDLQGAVTFSMFDSSLQTTINNKASVTQLNNALANYVTNSALNNRLSDYALASSLSGYVTSNYLANQLSNYATTLEAGNIATEESEAAFNKLANALVNGTTSVIGGLISADVLDIDTIFANAVYIGNFQINSWKGLTWKGMDYFGGTEFSLALGTNKMGVSTDMGSIISASSSSANRHCCIAAVVNSFGVAIYGSTDGWGSNFPAWQAKFAGFFSGSVRVTGGVQAGAIASQAFRYATGFNDDGTYSYYAGIDVDPGDYDLDSIRFRIRGGIIVGVTDDSGHILRGT